MTNDNERRQKKAAKLKSELQHYCGDMERYRHSFNRRVIYTPGVRHLAEEAGAYWLIDAIASWIGSHEFREAASQDERIGSLHFWRLKVNSEDRSAVLIAEADCDVEPFIAQKIPFTDFLFDEIQIWAGFDGQNWTLYLPSEH